MLLPFVISAQPSVKLSWERSADPNATGYNIYYGLLSRRYTQKISFGNSTNATISGLVAGSTYYFAVTAYDQWGDESDFSNEISYKVQTAVPPPTLTNNSTYGGLFYEANALQPQSSGAFKLSVSTRGAYSGSLQLGTVKLPFSGLLDPSSHAAIQVPRKNANALVVTFSLGPSNQVNGSVSDGTWTANLYGEQLMSRSPAKYPGKYAMVIQGNTAASPSLGNGFGVFTAGSGATVKFAGALADGTKLSQGAAFTQTGKWPFYVSLYSGNGLAMGWLTLANGGRVGLTGVLGWIKPPNQTSPLYSDGLAVECLTFRSLYNPGATLVQNLTVANLVYGGAAASNPTDSLLKIP